MTGTGGSGGAGTIVNAMATGYGAAFGLGFRVRATAEPSSRWMVFTAGRRLRREPARLAVSAARLTQVQIGARGPLRVEVRSEIPQERGLKSSSAVAVAVIRATLQQFHTRLPSLAVLDLAAQAGLESNTSLTGAFDDAAACLLGGVVLTDNRRRRILRRTRLPAGLTALVHVPRRRLATRSLRSTDFSAIAPLVEEAWSLARNGRIRDAMVLNTAAYAPLFGHRPRFSLDGLEAGAWAAGLSGKGPAEIALVRAPAARRIMRRYPEARRVPIANGGAL